MSLIDGVLRSYHSDCPSVYGCLFITASVYEGFCTGDVAIAATRQYLDAGVLANVFARLQAIGFEDQGMDVPAIGYSQFGYRYVLLGACAMTLGLHLPLSVIEKMKQTYKKVGLMRNALKQMQSALEGPELYQPGSLYKFQKMPVTDKDRLRPGSSLLNVIPPGPYFPPLPSYSPAWPPKPRARTEHPKTSCGHCGKVSKADGGSLVECAKCHSQKYCGKECQKSHWKVHKTTCKVTI